MIGRGLGKPELISRAKTDLQQIVVTAVLLIILTAFLATLCSLNVKDLGMASEGSMFVAAENYFEYAQSLATLTYMKSVSVVMYVSAAASTYIGGPLVVPFDFIILSNSPFSGLRTYLVAVNVASNLVMLSVSVMAAQVFVLKAIQLTFLNLLFPIGIVCRCFSPTRDFGGILIALSIGLFIFFPLMFAVSYVVIGEPRTLALPGSIDWGWFGLYFILAEASLITMLSSIAGLAYQIVAAIGISSSSASLAMVFFQGVGETILVIYLLPAISWIIVAMVVRDLSRVMGEEIDISTLSRMI
jgi:hypothetical protein